MNNLYKWVSFLTLITVMLSACTGNGALPTKTGVVVQETQVPTMVSELAEEVHPEEDVLFLNLIWHQHQPLYYPDENGVITRPWVRVHATKDYYDMASTVAKYPDVHVTFNLTPVLLMQLEDYVMNGAKDKYWVLSEKPADQLTNEDKEFLLTRFFDANWDHMIRVHPGYKRLLEKRNGTTPEAIKAALQSFTSQDFLDLQIWFNLAWIDPDFLEIEPLKDLMEKDQGFSEADKSILFAQVSQIMSQVIPVHKELLDKGQIEVITSPLAHPILPMLYDTNLALIGNPKADMPKRFNYVQDAIVQLALGREIYRESFGRDPVGLWPSEGSVAEQIVPLVSNAGYQWMASGEQVLANSLGLGAFTRDGKDTILQSDQFYRPYWVNGPEGGPIKGEKVLMVFRDNLISDKIGFTYSGTPGEEAAADFMQRMENIRQELKKENATGPHLVSIILDGENAWEYYDNDGKEFLNALYRNLSESKTIQTITVSNYMEKFPNQQEITDLFPGAWFSANYDTWIGEPEEKAAWNLLGQVRNDLQDKILEQKKTGKEIAGLEEATRQMYLAEGSDWFWWYGADQDSGNDSYFDEGYRALLGKVYSALGMDIPLSVKVPIIPEQVVLAEIELSGIAQPNINAQVGENEWKNAAHYIFPPAEHEGIHIQNLHVAVDQKQLYLQVEADSDWITQKDVGLGFYFNSPKLSKGLGYVRMEGPESTGLTLLGFAATGMFEIEVNNKKGALLTPDNAGWMESDQSGEIAVKDNILEAAIPLDSLGEVQAGDEIKFRLVVNDASRVTQIGPFEGPGRIILPDLSSLTTVVNITDPIGDDHGPGSYTYPTDAIFDTGVFDITNFSVRYDEETIAFDFSIDGEITNPWNGPAGYSMQTLDVYIDKDPGKSTGAQKLLPGRNASLQDGFGWDLAIWAESWTPQVLAPDTNTLEPKPVNGVTLKVILNPATSSISVRIPRSAVGEGNPEEWAYAGVILSQEGYPANGVWRVRDVEAVAAQWRIGGAPQDTNHTRILDVAWSGDDTPTQEEMLSTYPSSNEAVDTLPADGFARIEMLMKK